MASSQLIKLSQAVIMLFMLRREEAGVMRAGGRAGRRAGLGWRGSSDTGTAFGHRTCGRALHCIMQRVRKKRGGELGRMYKETGEKWGGTTNVWMLWTVILGEVV